MWTVAPSGNFWRETAMTDAASFQSGAVVPLGRTVREPWALSRQPSEISISTASEAAPTCTRARALCPVVGGPRAVLGCLRIHATETGCGSFCIAAVGDPPDRTPSSRGTGLESEERERGRAGRGDGDSGPRTLWQHPSRKWRASVYPPQNSRVMSCPLSLQVSHSA